MASGTERRPGYWAVLLCAVVVVTWSLSAPSYLVATVSGGHGQQSAGIPSGDDHRVETGARASAMPVVLPLPLRSHIPVPGLPTAPSVHATRPPLALLGVVGVEAVQAPRDTHHLAPDGRAPPSRLVNL